MGENVRVANVRIAIGLAYDGSGFDGWQTQSSGRGVQDHVRSALAIIAGNVVHVVGAGRTDTGVHATGQVAHFDTEASRPLHAWVRGTNSHLPPGVAVRWSVVVPPEFHARYSARARTYCYVLYANPIRPVLHRTQVGWFHLPLDIEAMRRSIHALIGHHDFSSFRAAECQAKTPMRTIHAITIEARGAFILFTLRADAFLHHMVRNIIGALVYVGKGAHRPEWIGELLAMQDRRHAPPTFPAAGLYLTDIEYDPIFGLPASSNESPWFDPLPTDNENTHQDLRHHDA
ncbi:MAG: tRNA pseudouridine(38-40) synthase TruA [Burkholderiales bacterium]